MARDRLAALRNQQGNSYNDSSSNPGAGGYQNLRSNPYARQDDRYEMTDVHADSTAPLTAVSGDDMSAFYAEISAIQDTLRTFNENIFRISDLHQRSLNNTDEAAGARNAQQLDDLVAATSSLSNQLKLRIKELQKKGSSGRDGQIRKQQTGLVKQKFIEAIQSYQQVEQQYRVKYKQRMERQFKIVKPDATEEEIKSIINDESTGGQIFTQSLQTSNRYGESRAAYREVQERHEDIKRIERTLSELAQLFNDMSILVEQQDETINAIQTSAMNVEKDTEIGLQHTEKAVVSARAARKKRWICFIITLIILAIVAIIVAVEVCKNNNCTKKK